MKEARWRVLTRCTQSYFGSNFELVEMKETRWRALTLSDSWMELNKEETETMYNAVQIVQ